MQLAEDSVVQLVSVYQLKNPDNVMYSKQKNIPTPLSTNTVPPFARLWPRVGPVK